MKDNNKKDKGFELRYYNLSYRRKFIRTLWLIPLSLALLFVMYYVQFPLPGIIVTIVSLAVTIFVQAYSNYKKWKKEDK